jgi:hypothetical protein
MARIARQVSKMESSRTKTKKLNKKTFNIGHPQTEGSIGHGVYHQETASQQAGADAVSGGGRTGSLFSGHWGLVAVGTGTARADTAGESGPRTAERSQTVAGGKRSATPGRKSNNMKLDPERVADPPLLGRSIDPSGTATCQLLGCQACLPYAGGESGTKLREKGRWWRR